MEIIIALLIFLVFALTFLVLYIKNNSNNNKTSDLLNFSESLTNQIQEVRKEIYKNSKESREDIESRLNEINKQMHSFTKSSSENMSIRFKQSDQVMKDVTSELEKIKGTNEKVLTFANQMKTLEKILGNQKHNKIAFKNALQTTSPNL